MKVVPVAKSGGKPGVMIYFETARALKWLDYEAKGRLFDAIVDYAENGIIPAFDGVLAAVWPFVANSIDRDTLRYEAIKEKRIEAGRKGGIANTIKSKQTKANEASATFDKQNKPTTTTTSTTTTTPTTTSEGVLDEEGKPSTPSTPSKPQKHKHGEYNNVLLTDEELETLKKELPNWEHTLERLSSYMASRGKSYKNHYAVIREWAKKDLQEQRERQETKSYARSGNPADYITLEDYANSSDKPF